MSTKVVGTLRYEPDAVSDFACHQGAGLHVHSDEFDKWWSRFGTDLRQLGPPTGYRFTSDDPVMVPYWDDATIAATKARRAEAVERQRQIEAEMAACPYVACECGHHEY